MRLLRLMCLLLVVGCTQPAPPEPRIPFVDASEGGTWDTYSQACLRLDTLGCPEAHPDGGTCYEVFRHADTPVTSTGTKLVELAPSCVATAGNKTLLRACSRAWKDGCK